MKGRSRPATQLRGTLQALVVMQKSDVKAETVAWWASGEQSRDGGWIVSMVDVAVARHSPLRKKRNRPGSDRDIDSCT